MSCSVSGRTVDTAACTGSHPVPVNPPPGFWEREATHFPQPLYPMSRSVWRGQVDAGARVGFEELSLPLETLQLWEIGGWAYVRMIPVEGEAKLTARLQGGVEAVRGDKAWQLVERWYGEWKPRLVERVASLRRVDLQALADGELQRHVAALGDHMRLSCEIHFVLGIALCLPLAEFFFACRDLLGWDDARVTGLLGGLSDTSSAPARALARLSVRVGGSRALAELLQDIDGQTAAVDPEFGAQFDQYVSEFGCRTLTWELADPTLAEKPEWLLTLLRDQLEQGYDPAAAGTHLAAKRARAAAEAHAGLAARPADRERFDRLLARAEQAYPLIEERVFYDISPAAALMRHAAVELGHRLALRHQIARPDDVFFLEMEEALDALCDGGNRCDLVRRRQGERAWVLAHPGPRNYGDPPPPPSPAGLPPEVSFAMGALMWAFEQDFPPDSDARRQDGVVVGIGVSAGTYSGPARVIRNEAEFAKIRAGDVLVCPVTTPTWSALFPSIGALVTDSGGLLSHPAIIAREYRIPAVLATRNATSLLRDGQMVTVDGAAGTVRLVDRIASERNEGGEGRP